MQINHLKNTDLLLMNHVINQRMGRIIFTCILNLNKIVRKQNKNYLEQYKIMSFNLKTFFINKNYPKRLLI